METFSRTDMVKSLIERDGPDCFLCKKGFASKDERTIDHWYPQSWCKDNGWTFEQTWALSNLRLAHKACNSRKANLVPVDDVTVPSRIVLDPFQTRSANRGPRPEVCPACNSGRSLGIDEVCDVCDSPPMPYNFPQWAKLKPNECSHSGIWWCWACMSGIIIREPASADVFGVLDGND